MVIKYYSGMVFPNYNHPAKLYDEIDKNRLDEILQKDSTMSYYIGFYQNNNLIRFEKYINGQKIFAFSYQYDEKDKLLAFNKIDYN